MVIVLVTSLLVIFIFMHKFSKYLKKINKSTNEFSAAKLVRSDVFLGSCPRDFKVIFSVLKMATILVLGQVALILEK